MPLPNGRPESAVVGPAIKFVDAMGAQGYLGIALSSATSATARHGPARSCREMVTLYDALAYLAAAQWARRQNGAG